jgi:hypothetical protein
MARIKLEALMGAGDRLARQVFKDLILRTLF